MKNLPLFYYPTTTIWVDDDKCFLETMCCAFENEIPLKSFKSALECLKYLNNYEATSREQIFLTSNTSDENYGLLQNTPVDFNVTTIADLIHKKDKTQEISVIVIDQHMPEMDGLVLSSKIKNDLIGKILLTGSEKDAAIKGFNEGLIDRYIKKSDESMYEKIKQYIDELSIQYFKNITANLLNYLETETKLPQSDPIFVDFFESYRAKNNIREYYLLDKQGSYLCVNSKNEKTCLIVHSDRSLNTLLEINRVISSLTPIELEQISSRTKIPFFGIGKELWQIKQSATSIDKYLHKPNILNGREKYYWSTIPLMEGE